MTENNPTSNEPVKCLTIMPFAKGFDDVYEMIRTAVEDSVEGEAIECSRLDEILAPGRITDDLLQALDKSVLYVADATGLNANVMWEMGYAMALRKPLIMITQDVGTLPFDLRDYRSVRYKRNALAATLLRPLKEAVRATLKKHSVRRPTLEPFTTALNKLSAANTIAVTGSMHCDPIRAMRRVEQVLSPHLGRSVRWLVGSYGAADEAAIRFLVTHREEITIVGYHAFDLSEGVRQLVVEHALPFVDARHEQIPKLPIESPSERDVLFMTKADLVVLLWDGASAGTREMIEWYERTHRDYFVTFV